MLSGDNHAYSTWAYNVSCYHMYIACYSRGIIIRTVMGMHCIVLPHAKQHAMLSWDNPAYSAWTCNALCYHMQNSMPLP